MEPPATIIKAIGETVIRSFLRHAMRDGFFHADMHQGNLFVDAQGKVVAVDFGIMGRLSSKERRFLAEILYGFIARDYRRAAEAHFAAGYVPSHHSVEVFAQALRAIGEPLNGRPAEEISMGHLLGQLFAYTDVFDMETRPELILLQKTMVVVEGVARHLDPTVNIWTAAEPIVKVWMEKELGLEGRLAEAREGAGQIGTFASELPRILLAGRARRRRLRRHGRDAASDWRTTPSAASPPRRRAKRARAGWRCGWGRSRCWRCWRRPSCRGDRRSPVGQRGRVMKAGDRRSPLQFRYAARWRFAKLPSYSPFKHAPPEESAPMIKLYDIERSGNCYKARLMLSLLGLTYEKVPVDLGAGEHKQADFLEVNPLGNIPVLDDNGVLIRNSAAILVYLSSKYGQGKWYPKSPKGMGKVQQWLAVSSNEVFHGLAIPRAIKLGIREGNYEAGKAIGEKVLKLLEQRLSAEEWLVAGKPSVADVAIYPYVAMAPAGRHAARRLSRHPQVDAPRRRSRGFHGAAATAGEEGLTSPAPVAMQHSTFEPGAAGPVGCWRARRERPSRG